jgi:hypothetical protein
VGRALKAGAVSLGMLGLLLVVALAARGGHPDGKGRISQRGVPYAVQNGVITVVVVVYVVAVVALVIAAFHYRHSWRQPESHWLRNFLAAVVVMGTIAGVYWAIARKPADTPADESRIGAAQKHRPQTPVTLKPVPTRQATFDWWLASSLVGLLAIGGTIVYFRLRTPRHAATERRSVEEDLAETVEITIDDLLRERDARRAVVAAYAAMERTLATHGLPRRRSETPLEYLARMLLELEVRESAVRSLTLLFEYAKFSTHEIDGDMRDEAVAALRAVRDDLRSEIEVSV